MTDAELRYKVERLGSFMLYLLENLDTVEMEERKRLDMKAEMLTILATTGKLKRVMDK